MMLNNYKPVSVLPVLSKLFERLMYNRLVSFVNYHKLLYSYQFGLREKYSTSLAMIYLVDEISQSLDDADYVLGLYVDFTKAFDTIKFHGTAHVSEIGTVQVPWNSMEFHGTARVSEIGAVQMPWNSMEFHATARVSEIGALQVPWNFMELLVSAKLAHSKFCGIPWNSMELLVSAKLAQSKFQGIPCNSMELLVSAKFVHSKFHGISWNCSCQRNWRTPSSVEFHVPCKFS